LAFGTDSLTIVGVVASVKEEGSTQQNFVGVYVPITQTQDYLGIVTLACGWRTIRKHMPPRCNAP
jgi:hypothetical protein